MRIIVETKSESAHYIPGHPKCGQIHGHSYKLRAEIGGKTNLNGMVVDFGDVKKVLRQFDHRCINDVAREKNIEQLVIPTAENLASYFVSEIVKLLNDHYSIKVVVCETENNCAEETYENF